MNEFGAPPAIYPPPDYMLERFKVTGLFYENEGRTFRKYLDIRRTGVKTAKPELMVVMMNPGSSRPLHGNFSSPKPVLVVPDSTQAQIMKLMESTGLNFSRILNLSDLRTPKSSELYTFLKSAESQKFDHSIFSHTRTRELKRLYHKNAISLFGWGVDKTLIPLATEAVASLGIVAPCGMLKKGTGCSYYHPLPQVYSDQQKWVRTMAAQIRRQQKARESIC